MSLGFCVTWSKGIFTRPSTTQGVRCWVYKTRREPISVIVPGPELRMMAMAPGGENRRDDVDPRTCMISLRIRRANGAAAPIQELRERFYVYETERILGIRAPSNSRRSAFGAHHFQPHITILKAGAANDPDLSKLGVRVRDGIEKIRFDRLNVRCRVR